MIKKFNLYKESLLDKISGPSEEDIRKHIDSITDINKKLSIAIKNDLLDVVEDIVNNGNYNEELSIRYACYDNKPDLVYYLLNNNDIYNIKNIKAINLVLIQSSEHGIFELVKFSLEHGADVNYGRSYSLRYAIMNNHMDIAKYLIKHGADVELADSFIIKYKKFEDSKKLHDLVNLKESLLDKISGPSEEDIKNFYKQKFLDGKINYYEYLNISRKLKIEPFSFEELKLIYENDKKDFWKKNKLNLKDFINICYKLGYTQLCKDYLNDDMEKILTDIIERDESRYDIYDIKNKLNLSNTYIFDKIKNININDKMIVCADLLSISELRKCIESGADVSYKDYIIVNRLKFTLQFNKKAKPLLDYVFSLIGLPKSYKEFLDSYFNGCELKQVEVEGGYNYNALIKDGKVILYSMLPVSFYMVIQKELYRTLYNFYDVQINIVNILKETLVKYKLNNWLGFNENQFISFRITDFEEVNEVLKESLLDKISGPSEEEIISNLSKNPNNLLLYACREGLMEYVVKSLEYGADIHFKNDLAIKTAAKCGYLDMVKYLISKGADFHIDMETPLRYASLNGHLDIVKYLINKGANIKAKSGDVLEKAILNGHIDVVKYLVEKGINVSKNKKFLDLATTYGNYEIVKYLVEHGADIYNDNAIYIAKRDKYYKIVIYLEGQIKKHIRQDFLSGKFGKYTMSLMDFKKYCSENEIEYLTDEEILLYKINYSNKHGDMEVKMDEILKIALRKDYKQIIDYFLSHPKEIDAEERKEIYYYFIKNGDLEMVKKLVDSGKIKFTNKSYFVDLRFILYGYLVERKIDMFLYIFKFYKKYTRWEIEWLYDMVNDKQTMGYKNNKEKMEIYKPVIDLLKKILAELK